MTEEELNKLEDLLSKLGNMTMDLRTEDVEHSFRVIRHLISKTKLLCRNQ